MLLLLFTIFWVLTKQNLIYAVVANNLVHLQLCIVFHLKITFGGYFDPSLHVLHVISHEELSLYLHFSVVYLKLSQMTVHWAVICETFYFNNKICWNIVLSYLLFNKFMETVSLVWQFWTQLCPCFDREAFALREAVTPSCSTHIVLYIHHLGNYRSMETLLVIKPLPAGLCSTTHMWTSSSSSGHLAVFVFFIAMSFLCFFKSPSQVSPSL